MAGRRSQSGHAARRAGLPRKRPVAARPEVPHDVQPLEPDQPPPPPEAAPEGPGPAAQCAKCETKVRPGEAIPLWDGKQYCRDCVEEACPGMADYALANPVLEEEFYHGGKLMLRGWLRQTWTLFPIVWLACATFLFGIPLLIGQAAPEEAGSGLLWLTAAMLAVLPGWLLVAAGFSSSALPRNVRVAGGQVTVTPGIEQPYVLEHGAWMTATCRYGRRGRALPGDPAVVLVFSSAVSRWHNFACGRSENMYGIWRGFLQLAGVPRARTPRPFLDGLLCWAVFLGAGALVAVPGGLLGWLADSYLLLTQFRGTLALFGGLIGGLAALRYLRCWLRGLRIRRARDPWIASAISAMLGYGFLGGAAIVAGAVSTSFLSFLIATVVTVICGLAGFVVGWHSWRRSVVEELV